MIRRKELNQSHITTNERWNRTDIALVLNCDTICFALFFHHSPITAAVPRLHDIIIVWHQHNYYLI